jgi:hypothetical protein
VEPRHHLRHDLDRLARDDIYALLVIEGQLSSADADLLHTDWFAELIQGGGSTASKRLLTLGAGD